MNDRRHYMIMCAAYPELLGESVDSDDEHDFFDELREEEKADEKIINRAARDQVFFRALIYFAEHRIITLAKSSRKFNLYLRRLLKISKTSTDHYVGILLEYWQYPIWQYPKPKEKSYIELYLTDDYRLKFMIWNDKSGAYEEISGLVDKNHEHVNKMMAALLWRLRKSRYELIRFFRSKFGLYKKPSESLKQFLDRLEKEYLVDKS